MRKPFYKTSHRAYFWKNDQGKLERLGTNEADAYLTWERLRNGEAPPTKQPSAAPSTGHSSLTVAELMEVYLEWVGRNLSPATHSSYERALRPLKGKFGRVAATEIAPKHLDEIVREKAKPKAKGESGRPWSETTCWHFFKATCAMFNWALEYKHIPSHDLSKIKNKPECAVRQDWIDQQQMDQLVGACDDRLLLDLLYVFWDTGARPFEILQSEARHLDRASRCLRFARSNGDKVKARRKKRDATRTVRLSERAFKIVCNLAGMYPAGPLFRNTNGAPWTHGLLSHRMATLKKRTGIKATLYTFRHSFCTRLILDNVNIRQIQELMGHQDLKMIAAVYAHLGGADDQLNSVLDKLAG
jgi:integrase